MACNVNFVTVDQRLKKQGGACHNATGLTLSPSPDLYQLWQTPVKQPSYVKPPRSSIKLHN